MTNLNYLYNSSDAQKLFGKNYFVDKTSGFTTVKHGTILPTKDNSALGGIVDGDGQYIKNSFLHYGLGKPYTHTQRRTIQLGKCRLCRIVLFRLGARSHRQLAVSVVFDERRFQATIP